MVEGQADRPLQAQAALYTHTPLPPVGVLPSFHTGFHPVLQFLWCLCFNFSLISSCRFPQAHLAACLLRHCHPVQLFRRCVVVCVCVCVCVCVT